MFSLVLFLTIGLLSNPNFLNAQAKEPAKPKEKTYPILLEEISPRFWVHVSFKEFNGTPYNSNGLVAISDSGILLVDTCWDNEQTEILLKKIKKKFKKDVTLAVITHAHVDRIGGIETLQKAGIPVTSIPIVSKFAVKAGFPAPQGTVDPKGDLMKIGDLQFEVFYPGPGHTVDNCTVWFPTEKIIFGGCLLKDTHSNFMGYIKEADLKAWPDSVRNLLKRYPHIKTAIPGHGKKGGIDVLHHTIKLIEKYNKNH